MDQRLQHLVNGLVLGATYALLGIGLTLIFGIMRVVNFAHGELYALGAYMAFAVVLWFFSPLAFGVGTAGIVYLLYQREFRSEVLDLLRH